MAKQYNMHGSNTTKPCISDVFGVSTSSCSMGSNDVRAILVSIYAQMDHETRKFLIRAMVLT